MKHLVRKYIEDGFEVIELKNSYLTARIAVNIGNTLFGLESEGNQMLYFPFSLKEYAINTKLAGNPFMYPWANRLEGDYITLPEQLHPFPSTLSHLLYRDVNHLPLHGLLLKSNHWKTIALLEEEGTCMHLAELEFNHPSWLAIFPFRHRIQMRHLLCNNVLTVETKVINEDTNSMPVSFGFHPYLLVDQQNREHSRLHMPAKVVIETNQLQIPNGVLLPKEERWNFKEDEIGLQGEVFDDCFTDLSHDTGYSILQLNDLSILMDINYPYVQVYAPNHKDKPYVCIEPMSAPANGMNTASCKYILPKGYYSATFKFMAL